jgi:hypothetical protein
VRTFLAITGSVPTPLSSLDPWVVTIVRQLGMLSFDPWHCTIHPTIMSGINL